MRSVYIGMEFGYSVTIIVIYCHLIYPLLRCFLCYCKSSQTSSNWASSIFQKQSTCNTWLQDSTKTLHATRSECSWCHHPISQFVCDLLIAATSWAERLCSRTIPDPEHRKLDTSPSSTHHWPVSCSPSREANRARALRQTGDNGGKRRRGFWKQSGTQLLEHSWGSVRRFEIVLFWFTYALVGACSPQGIFSSDLLSLEVVCITRHARLLQASGSLSHTAFEVADERAFSSSEGPRYCDWRIWDSLIPRCSR
jgi:hypothetical protein